MSVFEEFSTIADGDLYEAYQWYQAARDALLSVPDSALEETDTSRVETAVASRQLLAVVNGNLAAVCSSVDHGATIQVGPFSCQRQADG